MQQTLMKALALADESHFSIAMMMNNEWNDIDIALLLLLLLSRLSVRIEREITGRRGSPRVPLHKGH